MKKKSNLRQRLIIGKEIFLNDIKHAKWAVLLVFAYFVLLRKLFVTTCPAVLITGLPCPGCGMTRALLHLLHFDFAGAWQIHPFVYVILIFIIWFGVRRYIMGIRDTKNVWKIAAVIGIFMILFYIWRMLRYFPGDPPMSYYYGNLLFRIKNIVKSHVFYYFKKFFV